MKTITRVTIEKIINIIINKGIFDKRLWGENIIRGRHRFRKWRKSLIQKTTKNFENEIYFRSDGLKSDYYKNLYKIRETTQVKCQKNSSWKSWYDKRFK